MPIIRTISVLLILLPISIYAQRLNEHGLKMVSEVEVFDWELDKILLNLIWKKTNIRLMSLAESVN